MITSAKEFVSLLYRDAFAAKRESADITVWYEVIDKYPDLKEWVAYNITVPVEILELLAKDEDERVRESVSSRRSICKTHIYQLLSTDISETVRCHLIFNPKATREQVESVFVGDSEWLTEQQKQKLRSMESKV